MSTTALSQDEKIAMSKYRRLVFAGSFGTALENYDMFIYALIAPVVFDTLFFPKTDQYVGTLLVFATFTIGFLARPLGSIVFGHFGDKLGRKRVLIITLLVMGIASTLIGLLPGYKVIGLWAPGLLLLLRVAQGFALGGETAGAAVLALENAPQKKRGFYAACVQMGAPMGPVLAALAVSVLTGIGGKALFQAWLWRVPFILSAVLVIVGVYMRSNIDESMMMTKKPAKKGVPIAEVLRNWKKSLVLAFLCVMSQSAFLYLIAVFAISTGARRLGMSQSVLTTAFLIANIIAMGTVPLYGYLSDKVGRRPFLMVGIALCAAYVFPFYSYLGAKNQFMVALMIVVGAGFIHPLLFSQEPSFTSELWPTEVRYTGAAVSKHIGSVLGGGLAPLIAAALMGRSLNFQPVAIYYVCLAVVSFIAAFLAPESSKLVLTADKWTTEAELAKQGQSASAK